MLWANGSSPVISDCVFSYAYNIGVYYQNQPATPHINYCSFDNIGGNAVHNATSSVFVDARYNYWGASDGPSGEGPGSGEPVSTYVDFTPWLTADNEYESGAIVMEMECRIALKSFTD